MTEKKSSAELASVGSRIMLMARQGGPVLSSRAALRLAILTKLGLDSSPTPNGFDAKADEIVDVIEETLRPFIDDAERLAASVVSQA